MGKFEHPYAPFLSRVKKPAQYLGGEEGERRKDWERTDARICLAFPDLYEIGMSHLGFKILYGLLNDHPRFLAERAYAVWPDMEAEMRAAGVPLVSLESARPLRDFDVVGFSLQYELTYTNILQMLDLAGIPLRSSERSEDDPIVVAGGPCATHPEAIAPFIDAFLIGDGEVKALEMAALAAKRRRGDLSRVGMLRELAKAGGFYVPVFYERAVDEDTGFIVVKGPKPEYPEAPLPVERHFVENLAEHPFPEDGPVALATTIFDRVSVEIARGCTEGCRFCQAGMIYRPVRERPPEDIFKIIERSIEHGGYDEASLTSLSTADYSAITPLVRRLIERFEGKRVDLSVSSLRAYGLSESVLDDMATQRAKGLTFAPEAGTQRMRDVVNKNVTEAQLMETAERVFSRGWERMKLYFMIGLPTEEDEDILGIVLTGARTQAIGHRIQNSRRAKVSVSVSTHVPKPHTPFQWCKMDSHEEVLRKQALLRQAAREHRVSIKMHDPRGSFLEGVIARGDAKVADAIEWAFHQGARFDGWDEHLKLELWNEALARAGVDPDQALAALPIDGRLPWDHISVGLEEGFLAREYRRAVKNRLSPPCGKPKGAFVHPTNIEEAEANKKKLICYHCGIACDMEQMREERLVHLRTLGAERPLERRQALPRDERGLVDRRPMLHQSQGKAVRVRVGFRKLGKMSYHGHLDLVRLFPRLFRRIGLPVYYSEGYNPKPQMSFTPALPLGAAGLAELVDIKLIEDALTPEKLDSFADELNALKVPGLEFFGARLLSPDDRPLAHIINEARLVAAIPRSALRDQCISVDALEDEIRSRLAMESLFVYRETRGIKRKFDVRSALRGVRLGAGQDAIESAGLGGDLIPLELVVGVDSETAQARPNEILEVLLGSTLEARLIRASLHYRHGDEILHPLDLEAHRRLNAAQQAAKESKKVRDAELSP